MSQLQALKGTNLLDVQFLVDASNCVISNKRILQWLYVYGYYFDAPEGSSVRTQSSMVQPDAPPSAPVTVRWGFNAHSLPLALVPCIQDRALFEMHQAQLEKFTDVSSARTHKSRGSCARLCPVGSVADACLPVFLCPFVVCVSGASRHDGAVDGGVDEARDAHSNDVVRKHGGKIQDWSHGRGRT